MNTTICSDRPADGIGAPIGASNADHPRIMDTDSYIRGFLEGQTVAYCERVNTGMSLAAQLACHGQYEKDVLEVVSREGCSASVIPREHGRISIWIYRDNVAMRLIDALHAKGPSELATWTMGKLFGYSDQDVLGFLKTTSTSG